MRRTHNTGQLCSRVIGENESDGFSGDVVILTNIGDIYCSRRTARCTLVISRRTVEHGR